MKRILCICLALLFVFFSVGCTQKPSQDAKNASAEIAAKAVDDFLEITKVPRPGYHLDHIRDYLIDFAKKNSFPYERDTYGNVWMDVPATAGYENYPKVILQAHTDMICAAEKGYDIDFENTGLTAIVNENTITADKTSLGADNGIGIAIIMAIATSDAPHGPIRALFTADEDVGLLGAAELPAEALDADYLINIDDEEPYEIVCSNAGMLRQTSKKTYATKAPSDGYAVIGISVSGLLGGHSGSDIDKNRLSAVTVFTDILSAMKDAGIAFELGSLEVGTATNAIAPSGDAVLAVPKDAVPEIKKLSEELVSRYAADHPDEKPVITVSENAEAKGGFLSGEDSLEFLSMLSFFPQGVLAMSKKIDGLVQTSSNIGVVSVKDGECSIDTSTRSCVTDDLFVIWTEINAAAQETGYTSTVGAAYPGWDGDPNTKLIQLIKKGYEEGSGKTVSIIPVHAGLECSWFSQKRQGIQLASIGPKITDPHSVNETLYIDTIEPCVSAILYTLKNINSK